MEAFSSTKILSPNTRQLWYCFNYYYIWILITFITQRNNIFIESQIEIVLLFFKHFYMDRFVRNEIEIFIKELAKPRIKDFTIRG